LAHLIAVATSDGKTIYEHFGRVKQFHIVSIREDCYTYVETRNVTQPCADFDHSESAFDDVLSVLRDCEGIVVGKIGTGAYRYLLQKGMPVFELPGIADEVLPAFVKRQAYIFPKGGAYTDENVNQ